jgi:hypothetical protein
MRTRKGSSKNQAIGTVIFWRVSLNYFLISELRLLTDYLLP